MNQKFHFSIREMTKHELVGLVENYNELIKEHNKVVCEECIFPTFEKFWEEKERTKENERNFRE